MATSDKRGPYRRWMFDESRSIPRTTKWRLDNGMQMENYYDSSKEDDEENEQLDDDHNIIMEDDENDDSQADYASNGVEGNDSDDRDNNDDDHNDDDDFASSNEDERDDDDNLDDNDDNDDGDLASTSSEDAGYNLEGMFEPLYENASITVCGAYCAIMKFKALSLSPTYAVLQLICPTARLPKSVYMLRKFFRQFGAPKTCQEYCSYCGAEVLGTCLNPQCPRGDPDCFILIDTSKQFQSILSRKLL